MDLNFLIVIFITTSLENYISVLISDTVGMFYSKRNGRNDFIGVSKNLARYRYKDNFDRLWKFLGHSN